MTIVVRKLFHDFPRKNYKQIWGSLLLAVTIFFSAPLSVFLVNQNTLKFTFQDALPFYLGYTLLAFVILAALSIALKRFWRYLVVIYVALSLGFVIQGNYLLYDLGKMDGHTIEWSAFYRYIPVELLVWVGLIIAAVIFRKKIYKNFMFAAGLVFLLGVVPAVGQLASIGFSSQAAVNKQYFDNDKQFEFSSTKNVIIVVLDSFRSDAFEKIVSENPKYAEVFKDFTFYTNASAGYPQTAPSVPLILAGRYFENKEPLLDFLAKVQEDSLPTLLREHDITIEGYFFLSNIFPASWHNLANRMPVDSLRTEVFKQLCVTYLRYMPLPFKPWLVNQYYSGEDYYHKNIVDFYNNSETIKVKDKPPVFKYIHLSGVHPPFQLDESLSQKSFEQVDKAYMEQAKASINAVAKFIIEMKAAGIYDNSQIIILGDHGTSTPISPDEPWREDMDLSTMYRPDGILLRAEPLLLAKNINQQNNQLVLNDAPVSLVDISKTVADSLGLENDFDGYSIFGEIPTDRTRKFYYWEQRGVGWSNGFAPTLYEYQISGEVSDADSWSFQYRKHTKDGLIEVQQTVYEFGTNMVKAILTNSDDGLPVYGFDEHYNPDWPIWATGPKSCIYLKTISTSRSLFMEIHGIPYLVPEVLEKQKMVITLDNEQFTVLDAEPDMRITIPARYAEKYTEDGNLQLCFGFPDAKSPQQLGVNNDIRLLGYRFSSISIGEEKTLNPPIEVLFTKNNPPTDTFLKGFSEPEQSFTWTDEKTASIQLSVAGNEDDLELSFFANPFLVPGSLDSQRVIIRVNEQEITQLEMEKAEEISLTIPADLNTGLLKIEFELPDAASPYEHGLSEDRRLLGIAIHWLQIYEK